MVQHTYSFIRCGRVSDNLLGRTNRIYINTGTSFVSTGRSTVWSNVAPTTSNIHTFERQALARAAARARGSIFVPPGYALKATWEDGPQLRSQQINEGGVFLYAHGEGGMALGVHPRSGVGTGRVTSLPRQLCGPRPAISRLLGTGKIFDKYQCACL